MSQEEFDRLLKALEEKTVEVRENSQKAQELLQTSGVYTSDGHLTEPYIPSDN